KAARFYFVLQDPTRMNRSHRLTPSVVVDSFHLPSVAVLEPEADAPGAIDRHSPLILVRAGQLVQAKRIQGAQAGQRGRRVECGKPRTKRFELRWRSKITYYTLS